MPEPLDILLSMPPAELLALEQMGGTPSLPPDAIDRALRMQGYRTGRRPSAQGSAGAAAISMDPGLSGLLGQIYGGMTNEEDFSIPGAPPEPRLPGKMRPEGAAGGAPSAPMPPGPEPWTGAPLFEFLPPETIMAGVQRQVEQGTPASALPGDMAQTGGFNMPPGPVEPPMKPPGLMALSMPAIQQRMLMEAARAGRGGPGAGGVPMPPAMPGGAPAAPAGPPGTAPDPIATGAAAAQQAAAASGAQQAQTADPLAGLPEPLASALREYQSIAKDLKQQDENAKWMALAKAGFAMAGSRNPSFFGALGEGGMAGLQAYEQQQAAEAARRLQGVGMDMDVAKLLMQQETAQAEALRQAEKDELERRYTEARIGAIQRSGRGGGSSGPKPITQYQYAGMVQKEYDNLLNSPLALDPMYLENPELLRQKAIENVNSYLSTTGGAAAGGGSGGTSLQAVAGAAPEDLGAPDQYNEGDVVQSENGSMWVVMDGQYQPYEQ